MTTTAAVSDAAFPFPKDEIPFARRIREKKRKTLSSTHWDAANHNEEEEKGNCVRKAA